ncbi:MAG: efflux RND transporter periplasmic adaptor subunit [Gammaproteobacteria bacterium]|nr:efflux RND transporter periplasmic adaptor subunit [Gammaproteobacteria bacterium]
MMHRKYLALSVLLAILAGCQASDKVGGKNAEEDDKKVEPVPVEVATSHTGSIDAVYTGTATLEADGEAQVTAKVSGELIDLLVEEGDVVTAGQALANIDRARLELELRRAKANLDKLRQDYQRNLELHDKGLLPAGTFEGMKFDLDSLTAAYDLVKLDLSYTSIKAPIGGVVSERHIKVGNNVAIGQPLFTITDLDPLLAYLHVPEKDFQKLVAQQRVDLRVDALPRRSFGGQIARISPVVDAATGTFKVTIELQDKTGALKPGMFGRVAIVYETFENTVLVPRNAIVDSDGSASVFVVEDKVAKQRFVKTGHLNGADVQIVSGLEPGETIVVIGQNGLKDNGPVKVVNAPEKDPVDLANPQSAVAQSD